MLPPELLRSDGGPEVRPGGMLERLKVRRGETQSREGGQGRREDHLRRDGGQEARGTVTGRLYYNVNMALVKRNQWFYK